MHVSQADVDAFLHMRSTDDVSPADVDTFLHMRSANHVSLADVVAFLHMRSTDHVSPADVDAFLHMRSRDYVTVTNHAATCCDSKTPNPDVSHFILVYATWVAIHIHYVMLTNFNVHHEIWIYSGWQFQNVSIILTFRVVFD